MHPPHPLPPTHTAPPPASHRLNFIRYVSSSSMQVPCITEDTHFAWSFFFNGCWIWPLCFVSGDGGSLTILAPWLQRSQHVLTRGLEKPPPRYQPYMNRAFFYCHIHQPHSDPQPPTLHNKKKGECDLQENINHHSLYVNKFRLSPFTMHPSVCGANATFQGTINQKQLSHLTKYPNSSPEPVPQAQTHDLMCREG